LAQCAQFKPKFAVMAQEDAGRLLAERIKAEGLSVEVLWGPEALDFVSAHGGAVPSSAMGVGGQFSHPLVVQAKLSIASACHAHGKTPSHCVVTEFNDAQAMQTAASRAAYEFGFTRMWSIHPSQVRPILAAFSPSAVEVEQAADILQAAVEADWAPIQQGGQLHDRASYRFFWSVLERAHATGQALPAHALVYFQ
jgi:citrate lyase subunit beta/citryl-CoA lyase